MVEILKLLPKTNCKKCGFPTCLVFATKIAEGAKAASDCPDLEKEMKTRLAAYMKPFRLDTW